MQKKDYYDYEESFFENSGLKRFMDEKGVSTFLEKNWRKIATILIFVLLIGYIPLHQQKGILFLGEFYKPQHVENGIYFEDADTRSDFSVYVEWPGAEYCNVTYTKTDVGYGQQVVHKRYYQLEMLNANELVIYENDKLMFEGSVEKSSFDDLYYLKSKDPDTNDWGIAVYAGMAPDALTAMQVYRLYLNEQVTRGYCGTPELLWTSLMMLAFWLVDIYFPNLFFNMRYGLSVNNPEPSDYYLAIQKVGWVFLPIIAVVFLALSLV